METKGPDIKFCVCAFIDLLGFSSHLEIGSDLRTNIGQEAVERLKNLENAVHFVEREKKTSPDLFPKEFGIKRINDSLVLTLDLSDVLLPEIGKPARESAGSDIIDAVENEVGDNVQEERVFSEKYSRLLTNNTLDLRLFVGLVARIFNYIIKRENQSFFPGPKAVICSGYRKPFIYENTEDFLSANFAFSNAYIAESSLKGSGFYVENHILQLLSVNEISKNLLRRSLLIREDNPFDPARDYEDILYIPSSFVVPQPYKLDLFRKRYLFRSLNSRLLALFQIIDFLTPYIIGEKQPDQEAVYARYLPLLSFATTVEDLLKKNSPGFDMVYLDIEHDIRLAQAYFAERDPEFLSQHETEEKRGLIEKLFVDTIRKQK